MSTTKKSTEQVPFLERPIVRTILPIAGFVIICVLFAILTDGRLFQPKNISLLLSQSYMLLISSIGVFMVMTMGGLDFSQGSMLGVASIVVCYLLQRRQERYHSNSDAGVYDNKRTSYKSRHI